MDLKDYSDKDQEEIKKRAPVAEIDDKEAAEKILALVPDEWIKKIPFFVRKHSTTNPDLYAVAKKSGELPEKEREELREIITDIFRQKMEKHNIE